MKFTALGAFIFAVLKVLLVAETYGALVALVFAGLHLPLCLFSCLVVLWSPPSGDWILGTGQYPLKRFADLGGRYVALYSI